MSNSEDNSDNISSESNSNTSSESSSNTSLESSSNTSSYDEDLELESYIVEYISARSFEETEFLWPFRSANGDQKP